MDHKLILENSSTAAIYILPNTIMYLKAVKYFEYQTEAGLLNEP